MSEIIKPNERTAILQSLRAGVVPRIGLRHIQVGRKNEVAAVLQDLEKISQGSSTIRFIIGKFGSGKSFFLNLARIVALEKKFVVLQADITTDKRLHGSGGQAIRLYSELMQNMATKTRPGGGSISAILERWISDVDHHTRESGGNESDVFKSIQMKLKPLQDLVSGYDIATVVTKYLEGFQHHDDILMSCALRWLRGEYTTKTEARQDLGVRSIIEDSCIYDYLKLFASFVIMAGYAGLLVNLDEMGVLSHRLNNTQARNANYEMILRIVNDCLQGNVAGIGFMFGGTDAFLEDRRRGLFSYEALATRLADNAFVKCELKDLSGPVIRLDNLAPEDLYVLFLNIRNVFASGDKNKYLIPDEGIKEFLVHCSKTLGADYFRTPRDSVKAFVGYLSIIEQNPGTDWKALLSNTKIEHNTAIEDKLNMNDQATPNQTIPLDKSLSTDLPRKLDSDDDLATFKL